IGAVKSVTREITVRLVMKALGFVFQTRKIVVKNIRRTREQLVLGRRRTLDAYIAINEWAIENGEMVRGDATAGHPGRSGEPVGVVRGVLVHAETELMQVVDAGGAVRGSLGAGKGWQQQRRENPDDGNDHQQFD